MTKQPPRPPALSPKTKTLPESQRGAWFDGVDPVTLLGIYGTTQMFELPLRAKRFTLGSDPTCDVPVVSGFLSNNHCTLERRASKLRVHDLGSKNGTFYNGRREKVFDIRPGETFIAGGVRFVALNEEMRAAFPTLVEVLGGDDEQTLAPREHAASPSPSEVVIAATQFRNVLITGEPGCDHARLARALHAMSLMRARTIVEIDRVPDERMRQREIIDRAARSTLVIALGPDSPVMDAAFASMIFSTSYHIRVIAHAPSVAKAASVFGPDYVRDMQVITLQPLARRRHMILPLLDRLLEQRGADVRTANLTPSNQGGLQAADWPGNFDDLRRAADLLTALAREGSLRKTADALGVPLATLHYWLSGFGVSAPLGTASKRSPSPT